MMQEQEATAQVMNYAFKGGELAIKITGSAAKNLAVLIQGILTEKYKTGGAERLKNLIREGVPLKVFPLEKELLQPFAELAKKSGVTFSVVMDKTDLSAGVDIFIKDTDWARVNYLLEKVQARHILNCATIESAPIREEERNGAEYKERTTIYAPEVEPENPMKDRGEKRPSKSNCERASIECSRSSIKARLHEIRERLQSDLLQGAEERRDRPPVIPIKKDKEER